MTGAVTSGEMSETLANPKTANAAAPKHSRLAWLDALRGFAALCVVFDHGSTLMLEPVRDFLYRWLDLGEYGVFVFFLISGYIIPASLERKGSVRGFWTSRLFRLYPMYAVALALAALAYHTGHGTIRGAEHQPAQSVLAWLLMLPNLLTGPNVPNVTWTLSYEMVFYLLLVALFSWGVHRRSGWYATTFAVAAVALGGVLPMALLTRWAGHADGGGVALNAVADALILGGIVLAVASRSVVARVGASVAGLTALVLVMVNQGSPSPWEGSVILALMFTGTLIYRAQQRQPGFSRPITAAIVVGGTRADHVRRGLARRAGPSEPPVADSVGDVDSAGGRHLRSRPGREQPEGAPLVRLAGHDQLLGLPAAPARLRRLPIGPGAAPRAHAAGPVADVRRLRGGDHRAQHGHLLPGRAADAAARPPAVGTRRRGRGRWRRARGGRRPAVRSSRRASRPTTPPARRPARAAPCPTPGPGGRPTPTGRERRRRRGAPRAAVR